MMSSRALSSSWRSRAVKGETVGGGADGLFKMAQGFVGLRMEEGGAARRPMAR